MAPSFKSKRKNVHGFSSDFETFAFVHSIEPINAIDYSLIMGMNGEEALSYANREAKDKQLPQSILKQYEEEAKKMLNRTDNLSMMRFQVSESMPLRKI